MTKVHAATKMSASHSDIDCMNDIPTKLLHLALIACPKVRLSCQLNVGVCSTEMMMLAIYLAMAACLPHARLL
jgi:hypothetical protein